MLTLLMTVTVCWSRCFCARVVPQAC